jgi:hypothetical protein
MFRPSQTVSIGGMPAAQVFMVRGADSDGERQ